MEILRLGIWDLWHGVWEQNEADGDALLCTVWEDISPLGRQDCDPEDILITLLNLEIFGPRFCFSFSFFLCDRRRLSMGNVNRGPENGLKDAIYLNEI